MEGGVVAVVVVVVVVIVVGCLCCFQASGIRARCLEGWGFAAVLLFSRLAPTFREFPRELN